MVDGVPFDDLGESGFSDEELTALALADRFDAPIDAAAVPLASYLGQIPGLLPQWYMPTAIARGWKGWRTAVVIAIVATFVVIEALGLCSAYGQVVIG